MARRCALSLSLLRLAIAIASSSALALGLASGSAAAIAYGPYSCGFVAPNAWCDPSVTHTFGYYATWEYGEHPAYYCAKLTKPEDLNYNYARRCDYGELISVFSDGGGRAPYPNNSVSMKGRSANGNNAGYLHIITYGNY